MRQPAHRRGLVLVVVGGLMLSALSACATSRRSEPLGHSLPIDSPQLARGERLFMAHCHQCHPGGDTGLGPALNDKPLPGFLMKFQIRNGIGAMPAFSSSDISGPDLDALVAYVVARRQP